MPPLGDAESAGRTSRGIQSVEVGGQLLLALAHTGRPMALKDLAQAAGMTPAKAHPYLVSFGKIGLIGQDDATGRYGLGPLALQLGLISLQQVDPVRLASAELPALARQIGHTVAIAVWGNRGPTIIRLEEGPAAVHVNMRHGTVVSVRGTASGRLFAALLPRDKVLAALRVDQAAGSADPVGAGFDIEFEAELAQIRQTGLSRTVGGTVPGVTALAVPVYDGFGAMVLGLITIGPSATLDPDPAGPAVRALRQCAEALSRGLGARPGG
ncbi:MAG: IclR family transcriptional regulator [Leptothrix sp. (in: b-proteobacteria)]